MVTRESIGFDSLNICSGIPCSGQMVIDILTELTSYCPKIEIDPKFVRKNEVWKMIGNPERLLEFMNGESGKELTLILKEMLDYYYNK